MKKINKFAAAIAVALSMGMTPQANAEIEFHPNGRGDALLFPVFNGYVENYFTVMNNHNAFIQGHLRFRGAAWSGELRDFDVILSPGDVFVFRIADIDGDGMWEIDQSLDIKNFQYTGLGGTPEKGGMDGWTCSPEYNPDMKIPRCMDPSDKLIPKAADLAKVLNIDTAKAQAIIDYQKHTGYVEFIGEAVLNGLDYNIMEILLGNNPGAWVRHQTKVFSRRGTNAWVWSDAPNDFNLDHGLSDVPNALSGTAFITIPGMGSGVAYNAEALVNFRTSATGHRIDNYRMVNGDSLDAADSDQVADNQAVILHHEDGASQAIGPSPMGDYVYQFDNAIPRTIEDRTDEARISFNNTWGPTLADGDDYDIPSLRTSEDIDLDGIMEDDFDHSNVGGRHGLDHSNSIAEVEEAIRLGVSKHPPAQPGPQVFSSYYFDGDLFDKSCEGNGTKIPNSATAFCPNNPLVRSRPDEPASVARTTLSSYYFAFFPTKFFYGEDARLAVSKDAYLLESIVRLLRLAKPVNLEVWDIFEKTGKSTIILDNSVSPAVPVACPESLCQERVVGYELSFFSIRDIKSWVDPQGDTIINNFRAGRVVVGIPVGANNPMDDTGYERSWPGLMYTFEWDGDTTLANWRPMHRMIQ